MTIKHLKDLGFIRLPNNENLIPALLSYAAQVAGSIGFSPKDCNNIQLALEEACMDVIKNAFAPNEEAEIDIIFLHRLDGIEIHIHDMGLPYDPNMAPTYDPTADLAEEDLDGLGSFLIKQMTDEYHFNNLGIKGKECVLIKYFDTMCVFEGDAPRSEPEVAGPPPKTPVEQIDFDIRFMKDDEALEVCRCIYDCYGYSYVLGFKYLQDPELKKIYVRNTIEK